MNLGVGAYRDDAGKPFILQSVREAERRIVEGKMNHEYAAIGGVPEFVKVAKELALGKDSSVIQENRVKQQKKIYFSFFTQIKSNHFFRLLQFKLFQEQEL